MKRRAFVQTLGAAAAGGLLLPTPNLLASTKKLDRIGLELYAVRHAMAKDPERTLAAVRAIGYTDVELLWSFDNFNRTPAQVAATLKSEGLRARSRAVGASGSPFTMSRITRSRSTARCRMTPSSTAWIRRSRGCSSTSAIW